MRRLAVRAVLVALPLLVLSAFPALASLVDARSEIRLTERGFAPQAVDVEVGEAIVWVNRSRAEHTLVGEDGSFDSGPLRPGETFTIELRESGTVRYATADGSLEGEIRVAEAAPADEAVVVEVAPVPSLPANQDDVADGFTDITLPNTGGATTLAFGVGLLLLCTGGLVLRRARDGA